jgi:hypothetical protein
MGLAVGKGIGRRSLDVSEMTISGVNDRGSCVTEKSPSMLASVELGPDITVPNPNLVVAVVVASSEIDKVSSLSYSVNRKSGDIARRREMSPRIPPQNSVESPGHVREQVEVETSSVPLREFAA